MRPALGSLAAAQTKGTQATAQACAQLLDYAATHPNAKIRYYKSDMVLYVHSDASYLSEPNARSRAGGHFYLSQKREHPDKPPTKDELLPPPNGPLHTVCNILSNVMASAAEAETGAVFVNAQDSTPIRQTLLDMGHPQLPMTIQTDNSCAEGIINQTIKQKWSKAMDMHFHRFGIE